MGMTKRESAAAMSGAEFRALGHDLVDRIAEMIDGIDGYAVAKPVTPSELRALLPDGGMPTEGSAPGPLFREILTPLLQTSTLNAHPRFFGYISGSPAPACILADLVASALNPNCGAWILSPLASELEVQTISWLAELLDYPAGYDGILVSGGNMANLICFMAARAAAAPEARAHGLRGLGVQLTGYASSETHTWINKAADVCGLGSASMRSIKVDADYRMSVADLRAQIERDLSAGLRPFIVVASAGTVSTGAIDPIAEIAELCRQHSIWLHVDGAYGAPAAMLPEAGPDLKALRLADSLAIDPHKWLYTPMEAGAALVRDPEALTRAFAHRPPYYKFESTDGDPRTNFYEHGLQNSRGFRALKVWLALRQLGRAGYQHSLRTDIELARLMYDTAAAHPDLEALTHNLSITTFRYVPADLRERADQPDTAEYLNQLNEALVGALQAGGELFLSNAVLDGRYALRACIVNFRTSRQDVSQTVEIAVREGARIDQKLRR